LTRGGGEIRRGENRVKILEYQICVWNSTDQFSGGCDACKKNKKKDNPPRRTKKEKKHTERKEIREGGRIVRSLRLSERKVGRGSEAAQGCKVSMKMGRSQGLREKEEGTTAPIGCS